MPVRPRFHDARLAAVRTHGIAGLLAFNPADFARFPGLTIHDRATIAAPVSTTSTAS